MTFDFHPEAEAELYHDALWYEDRSAGLGGRFIAVVKAGVNAITNDPERFQRIEGDIQVYRLKRFPYRIYYVHEALIQNVRIYAVMHEKRRPGNWRERVAKI